MVLTEMWREKWAAKLREDWNNNVAVLDVKQSKMGC